MRQFTFTITDELGLHARPAGQLVKLAAGFQSQINISLGNKTVDAKRILGVMQLGADKGSTVNITCEGSDEDAAADALEAFLTKNA